MFGFFLQSGQILRLPRNASLLKDYPQMCSTGSSNRPDLIPNINQVIPQYVKIVKESYAIPLFIPMKVQNGHLHPIGDELPTTKFCLMFYPNPESPPTNNPLVIEYWKSLRPMLICYDMGGYYLGCPEDSNISFFEQVEPNVSTNTLKQAINNYKEDLAYGAPDFGSKQIYLRRCRSS